MQKKSKTALLLLDEIESGQKIINGTEVTYADKTQIYSGPIIVRYTYMSNNTALKYVKKKLSDI